MNRKLLFFILILSFFVTIQSIAQEAYNLKTCVDFALENNHNLKKSELDRQKSQQSRQEILGNLLPQVNGSGSMSYNLKKPKFIMPNFINDMLPPVAQDPNAAKYLTIEMGTNYSAGLGATLNQQVFNYSLFSMLELAKIAESMASLNIESKEEDIIAQTASLFYSIQSTEYAVGQFKKSLGLIEKMLKTMETNFENGMVRKVDVDRMKVNRVNLATQLSAIQNAIEIQKNLLKLQLGFSMDKTIAITPIDLQFFENKATSGYTYSFQIDRLIPFKVIQQQQKMSEQQVKSVLGESLPSLTFGLNYQHNFISDEFFTGETYYNYPSSNIGLNLRVPIFGGLSRSAKLKGAKIEQLKLKEDELMISQTLNMAYKNALLKLSDSKKTIEAQRENIKMVEEVFSITESNFMQGLASMSDVLNANSSLIQAQLSYSDALNNYMKAYVELHKANGTIKEITE